MKISELYTIIERFGYLYPTCSQVFMSKNFPCLRVKIIGTIFPHYQLYIKFCQYFRCKALEMSERLTNITTKIKKLGLFVQEVIFVKFSQIVYLLQQVSTRNRCNTSFWHCFFINISDRFPSQGSHAKPHDFSSQTRSQRWSDCTTCGINQ